MSVKMSMSGPEQHRHADQLDRPFQQDVLDQVERIVGSTHFRNSKRYPALLRFIVEEALAGRGESLKERTLGIEVFGRSPDYDTNADPVVRVSAGEIRKRLAQYYQAPQHEGELQVDLPLGSYAPHFFSAASRPGARFAPRRSELLPNEGLPSPIDASISVTPTIAESSAQTPVEPPAIDAPGTPFHAKQPGRHRRLLVWLSIACGLFLTALLVGGLRRHGAGEGAVTAFWRPLLESKDAALIVIGVHTFDETGKDISPSSDASTPLSNRQSMLYSMTRSDMVSVTDLYAYSAVVNLLAGHSHPFRTQGSSETTLEQLRRGPVVLVGGFNNIWTMRLTSKLRFRFVARSTSLHAIEDVEHPENAWTFDSEQDSLSNSRDYGIAGCFFDPQLDQYVLFAAGIGKSGTEAAAEFLSSNSHIAAWQAHLRESRHANAEVVLSTEIIEGKSGPPKVIASAEW